MTSDESKRFRIATASVASGFGLDADGAGALDPLLGGEDKTIEPCLLSNPIEFDGIKTGVVDLLPDTEELDGVAVAQPVEDEVVSALWIFVSGDVGEADVVVPLDSGDADFAGENFDFLAHGLGGVWRNRREACSNIGREGCGWREGKYSQIAEWWRVASESFVSHRPAGAGSVKSVRLKF